ncbi:AraC family transcriptional regulator [Chitinophaga pendula]|uniref:helix-turn-helix domain-containing protein n=1 Tax=Chitinophaga TaxID=79328 RepID=UPI000BAFBC4F|nr:MULTISPECIES: AraC family transcriptional regulator [Chitinophaga]ASZ12516.1 AraC family transcriptional regulator [Chitinophaga sp. MD30]UCJ09880.1 AraC family transcriptional regulator [Chitinophaga pendula]
MRHKQAKYKDHFPVLNIQEFSKDNADESVLFHELHGERAIEEPHKHDFFIAVLFGQGSGTHTIDFVEYPIGRWQLHLVFPGQVHQWRMEKETIACQLMIENRSFEALMPDLRFPAIFYQQHPVMELKEDMYKMILYEFLCVQKELKESVIFPDLIRARCGVCGLLISRIAEKRFKEAVNYNTHPILTRFVNLIDKHYKEEHAVAFYANEINISPNYLNMVCQKQLNVAASSLVQSRLVLEAKRLLKASRMTVKEIVFDLGFYDHASFSKFFKSHTGMTPSAFKELK